jgi:hypothetical protein
VAVVVLLAHVIQVQVVQVAVALPTQLMHQMEVMEQQIAVVVVVVQDLQAHALAVQAVQAL